VFFESDFSQHVYRDAPSAAKTDAQYIDQSWPVSIINLSLSNRHSDNPTSRDSACDCAIKLPVELKPGYEWVFTVADYHDGPRSGIANYRGQPYFYKCVFDEAKDEYSELFLLTPLDPQTFQLAMEDWGIWRRWKYSFHAETANVSTHPALPREAARHAELKRILDDSLESDTWKAFTVVGRFEPAAEPSLPDGVWQVKWDAPRTDS
jgi:hypothetical protein